MLTLSFLRQPYNLHHIPHGYSMIAQLFAQSGQDAYYGEPVTQLEHALQCAHLAEQHGADDETVAAAFLHDIGHLLPPNWPMDTWMATAR